MRQVTVRSLNDRSYAVEADNGRGHVLVADEPPESGGEDLGPTPHELLITSLGACVAITIRMYAQRHEWPLEDISVHLTIDDVAPSEPEFTPEEIATAGPSGKLPLIHSHVTVKGNLDEAQLARIEQIAGRCPVHRALRAPPAIVTMLTHDA
jgi:putative redox protein